MHLNGDGLDDLAYVIFALADNVSFSPDGLTVGVVYSTGRFDFQNRGQFTTTTFQVRDGSERGSLPTLGSWPLLTGIDDFNADGNEDLFIGSYATTDWSWVAFGSSALEGNIGGCLWAWCKRSITSTTASTAWRSRG